MYNLHPGLILIAAGVAALALPAALRKWVCLAGSVLALAATLLLDAGASLSYDFTGSITMELLQVDGLSKLFGLIFCVIAVICAVYSFGVDGRGEKCASLVYAGSSLCVVFAGDWISLICFWELMAVSSWYLVWTGKTDSARRASYRYIAVHFFGGNLLLGGAIALCMDGSFDVELLTGTGGWGCWLVFIGVAVNGAIPPLHSWVADAYPESTPSGTVYMGSYTTKAAVYALIRLFAGTEELVLAGALMAVFAACMALLENDLRRLLSYHIVSQLGMMVAALGTGSSVGIDGAALHAAYNILYKGVLLMGAGAVVAATGKRKITQLGGLWKRMPFVSICFLIASLSIAGVPFLSGFASKALIMDALHQGHFVLSYWLVMAAGVGTWLSITMKINYFVFYGKTDKDINCGTVPLSMKLAMAAGAVLCVVTGVIPQVFYAMTPYQTMGHPFTVHHILEYIGLFIGASLAFVVFLKKMAPHDQLTLDFDWFYRRPLPWLLSAVSRWVYKIFARFERIYNSAVVLIKFVLRHPKRLFSDFNVLNKELILAESEREEEGAFEGNMPVGAFMQIFMIFCIIAFIIILIIK